MSLSSSLVSIIQLIIAMNCFLVERSLAYNPNDITVKTQETPKQLEGVGLKDHTGDQITLDLPFIDQDGQPTSLGSILAQDNKPALLSIVYYGCPNLCNLHLDGVVASLKDVKWTAGRDFHLIAISLDPSETPDQASAKRDHYMTQYGRAGIKSGWHFLTGKEDSIKKITQQLGFSYRWNSDENQWAHSSSAYIITPKGLISRSLPGISFDAQTLKMGILEASNNKIGNIIEQIVLYCYRFDPHKNKYTIYAFNIMRVAGLITVVLLGILLIPVWIREFKRSKTI